MPVEMLRATTPAPPSPPATPADGRERVLAACRAMDDAGGPLPPEQLAAAAGWSTRQLHRRFAEVTGTTPRAYGEALRAARLGPALAETRDTVLDAAFATGYGSVRAFYEQGAARLGMTPSAWAGGGRGERLLWTAGPCSLAGEDLQLLVVASLAGVVAVRLGSDVEALLAEVAGELPLAQLAREDDALTDVLGAVRALARGSAGPVLPVDVRGTAFQAAVWAALRRIPAGQTRSYAEVAAEVGSPGAVRAVGTACARNPAALVTPCHRVVRSDGGLGGFRWGLEVKRALLDAERG
ncbi:methylated-DNA--[protein]-cysteine S-methyltransferase [Quadrisphaera sp. INWT6]|uniref:methylated-DNA--[protein]-cysteine S-methyltransferase n=1 Tax=Quadrisphaera sp. INWT6 TaxID=2596917 RepID=UPI001892065C|nr:methylated-DNA--[protein]-cysteine S-methyltransferase [Quadrisphaera sp. INWT6]MBF5081093.1 methylated-DNA--[protein]-cysteine S-methyltransferase [Quadrisphaera sp. INWT6]